MSKRDVGVASVVTVLLTSSAALAASTNPAAPHAVFRTVWADSMPGTNSHVVFDRPGEATYFDLKTQRIVTVPGDTPRFVSTPKSGKRWGEPIGLLLEGATSNLLMDSSFEEVGTSGAWQFTGQVEQQAGAGVHGEFGLRVRGPATIAHAPVPVRIYPEARVSYYLSLYVRRTDGGEIGPGAVQGFGQPVSGPWDERQIKQLAPVRMGDGPWYRVATCIGAWEYQAPAAMRPTTNLFTCGFRFDGQEYAVDAAQLEYAQGNQHALALYAAPSSYVPAARAPETLAVPVQAVLPGQAWSFGFWSYTDSAGNQNQRLCGLWGDDHRQGTYLRRNCVVNPPADYAGATADHVPATGWVYLTVTYDGAQMDFFVNGVSDHTRRGPFPVPAPVPLPGKMYWARDYNQFPNWGGEMLAPGGPIADFTSWDRALTPDEVKGLCATGQPCVLDSHKPSDVPVTFTLKRPGKVSLNLYHPDGRLAEKLLIGKPLPAGKHTVFWDGCDDTGQPVPAATYRIKGLCANVRSV